MAMRSTDGGKRVGESRLPMALAVIVTAVLFLLLPSDYRIHETVHYFYPALLVVLLAVLIVGDPGRIDREKPWLRMVTGVLVATITLSAAISAIRLVMSILNGIDFGGAQQLLGIGTTVWITAIISFALWYWHLDRGGPAARAHGRRATLPAFHFPEQDLQEPEYEQWYPQFIDYLALSFNTGTAFSPTDVTAVRHWSKLWLITESAISLAIIGLVIADAINTL